MEWRHEAVRWFDQWLKGVDTGILDEPRFAVFVRDWHPPGPHLEDAPGRWRYEDGWPIARIREQMLYPQDNHTPRPTRARRGDAPAALRALGRRRGRRAGDVVGRRRARPARHRCLQPRLRQRAARRRHRDPRLAARDADGRRRRAARQLVRAALGRRARRHGHAGGGRGDERHTPRIGARAEGARARTSPSSSTSRCISRPGCSPRAIASGSRSTMRNGRCSGRRPSR